MKLKDDLMNILVKCFVLLIVMYLLGCFAYSSFDISVWSIHFKVIMLMAFGFVVAAMYVNEED